ncbi:YkgJ family cysteine cluster protein [Caenorhabditis elegans]|uniref:YkgJ family cysteine cluster protein n=1 Tax=Caenorhabditis elegans TaxID=6239 RepID=Q22399_CAEEL|nr:YkgJ family cysteine cluster protein [Caenorhabditis elegans]CAA98531.2 YkgJ family cysteine cluster protein [Caenorhabditis elegans]|eukprot:NP_001343568.1 Uncharacterized protein CELE_T11F9.7 [Caenorhabditis elegans]
MILMTICLLNVMNQKKKASLETVKCFLFIIMKRMKTKKILAKYAKNQNHRNCSKCSVYNICCYTYRPKLCRRTDKHFKELPSGLINIIKDLSLDISGLYLPQTLLTGRIDLNDEFVASIEVEDAEKSKEILRRRRERPLALRQFSHALSRAMANLRTYHYDVTTEKIERCPMRNSCKGHLKWEQMRKYRAQCKKNFKDPSLATVEDMMSK